MANIARLVGLLFFSAERKFDHHFQPPTGYPMYTLRSYSVVANLYFHCDRNFCACNITASLFI